MKQTDMSRTARADGDAVQTAGLTKRFGGRTAVDRVDLLVPAGTAVRTWRTWRRLISVLPVLAALLLAACSGGAGSPAPARQASGQPPPCSANPPPEAPPLHPTTVTTIGASSPKG